VIDGFQIILFCCSQGHGILCYAEANIKIILDIAKNIFNKA